jgi:hypothetical protein
VKIKLPSKSKYDLSVSTFVGSLQVEVEAIGNGCQIRVHNARKDKCGKFIGRDPFERPLHIYGLECNMSDPTMRRQVQEIAQQCLALCQQAEHLHPAEEDHDATDDGSAGLLATPDGGGERS